MANSPAASEGKAQGREISHYGALSGRGWPAIERASEILLSIEPVWALGAFAFVYLSVLNMVGGHPWLGLLAGMLPYLARWAIRGHVSRRTPFDLPIVLLLLAGLVGVYVSSARGISWGAYQTLLACLLVYYSFANYDRPGLIIKWGLLFFAVGFLGLAGYVFLQRPTSFPVFSQIQEWLHPVPPSGPASWAKPALGGSPTGSTLCGITVATEVATMMVAGVALFSGTKKMRTVACILTILLLGVLVVSGCGATWIMLAAGMVVLLAWRSKWLLLSLPAWLGIVYWSVTTRIIGRGWGGGTDFLRNAIETRFHVWEVPCSAIAEHPITGAGLGGYALPYSHSAYLQFYLDFGLLGVVALIVGAVAFIKLGLRLKHAPSNHPWRGVAVGAWVAILLGSIYSVIETAPACILAVGNDSYYYAITPMFLLLAAAIVIADRMIGDS